jgi:hypothetical protein
LGKTSVLTELICIASRQGEKILVTAPSNAVVDNMVERLVDMGLILCELETLYSATAKATQEDTETKGGGSNALTAINILLEIRMYVVLLI